MTDLLCVGVVLGAHGIRGAVRIRSLTEVPADIAAYGPLREEKGPRQFEITLHSAADAVVIARLSGVNDRTAAEQMKGVRLMVPRAALPAVESDEFYVSDLIGLAAWHVDGTSLGTVKAVHDFGGGDILEITGPQGTALYAFTLATVPVVDLAAGRIEIDPPIEVSGQALTADEDVTDEDEGKTGD